MTTPPITVREDEDTPVVRDEVPAGIIARADLLGPTLRLSTEDPRTVKRERVKAGPRGWATCDDGAGARLRTGRRLA